jgi:nucleoside-diphosphate-sugar epimerase
VSQKLFCFGYGYSCDFLASSLEEKGDWVVTGTTRSPEKQKSFKEQNRTLYIFNYHKPLGDPSLFFKDVTHLLLSAPPNDDGDPVFLMHAKDILNISSLKWVGYLSSSATYGDHKGNWVDENTEIIPNSIRGSRRAKAEKQWRSLYRKHNLPIHIFRVAGIYGPGRSAIDSVKTGIAKRIYKPDHAFNRIHVKDIAQALTASMHQPNPGSIYNLSDDCPAPSHEIIDHACKLLNIEPPPLVPLEEANLSPMARSFYADNKRVKNDKIKQELGVNLLFPDYKSGLQDCL